MQSKETTIEEVRNNIKEWCYAKRNEIEQLDPQNPTSELQLTNCMFEAIFWVMADMEIRLRKLEQNTNNAK
jgi:hypothetical protein